MRSLACHLHTWYVGGRKLARGFHSLACHLCLAVLLPVPHPATTLCCTRGTSVWRRTADRRSPWPRPVSGVHCIAKRIHPHSPTWCGLSVLVRWRRLENSWLTWVSGAAYLWGGRVCGRWVVSVAGCVKPVLHHGHKPGACVGCVQVSQLAGERKAVFAHVMECGRRPAVGGSWQPQQPLAPDCSV